ncbi:VOC family protein [Paenibacillus sp. CC-CFT747]|nr:VOC family protein [Paenibacillus sp. CC-CFT747]
MSSSPAAYPPVIPILRVFQEEKAKEFYLDFLEFQLDWEHRFEEGLPLYRQVSRGDCVLHLSEHHGDACPGAAVRIHTEKLEDYQKRLLGKAYKYARPGIHKTPWNTSEMSIHDPFGNRLVFFEAVEQKP